MRTADITQHSMFSYLTLGERFPAGHPLRKLRAMVVEILVAMDSTFATLYLHTGRPGIAPERLLRTSMLQELFSFRSLPPKMIRASCP